MDDLTRRSDAIKEMAKAIGHIVYDAEPISCHVMDSIPAVEPKRGEWIRHDEERDYCSVCKHIFKTRTLTKQDKWTTYVDDLGYNFCPQCGAKMFAKDTNVPNKEGADDE